MPTFENPLRTMCRLLGLAILVGVSVVSTTAQGPQLPDPPPLPACADLDRLGIPKQMNLRAAAAMIACGRAMPGEEQDLGIESESLVGGNVDTITGVETNPKVTQSEHQIWVEGTTVVVNYNDSRDSPANYSGMSYSTDSGATYTRIIPSPFATGHGTNYGDPVVVYNKKLSTWYAADLATGCGGQGIGMWTSANGISWSPGACVHTGANDDRESMAVDNNPASPFYGRMYVSWNNFDIDGALYVTRSDNGTTWSAIEAYFTFIRDVQIQVAPNGNVILVAMDESNGGQSSRRNYALRSTDGGATFSGLIPMGAPFAPPCDFTDSVSGYFRVCNPIWRHMGWGDLATGSGNVAVYSYAAAGAPSSGGSLVPNGGFETGNFTNWTIDGNLSTPTVTNVDKHTGTFSAHLGDETGVEPDGDSSFYQQITLGANPGYLSYWYKGFTTDNVEFDWQDAYITDSSGTILATVMHECVNNDWTNVSFNLAPYANSTIRIKFLVHQDGFGDDTAMYVDDVTIGGTASDNGDIYTVRSTDNGATWGAPKRMDGTTSNGEQWMPSTTGGGPYYMVSWYDRKNTLNNNYERFAAISRDSGVTWTVPQRISDMIIPQPAQPDPAVQPLYAGDYMRGFFDAATATFYDGWTDGRVMVAGANQQDVETQRVRASSIYDFDGDSKTDSTVWRPSNGVWYTAKSSGGATITGWGVSTDIDVAGDYDGDGKTDIAVFRPASGLWLIVRSSNGTTQVVGWGVSGDVPIAGDYDGDGKDDQIVYRPSSGVWFINKSGGGTGVVGWGVSTDYPLVGDYDGDGKKDVAIYRPSTGVWYILYSGGGSLITGWGTTGDIPVVGDYDGDGKADLTVFRPSAGLWLVSKSTGGILAVGWGTASDTPLSGDQDGDGKSDFIIFRDASGVWFTQLSGGGTTALGWGISGDKPTGRRPGS